MESKTEEIIKTNRPIEIYGTYLNTKMDGKIRRTQPLKPDNKAIKTNTAISNELNYSCNRFL